MVAGACSTTGPTQRGRDQVLRRFARYLSHWRARHVGLGASAAGRTRRLLAFASHLRRDAPLVQSDGKLVLGGPTTLDPAPGHRRCSACCAWAPMAISDATFGSGGRTTVAVANNQR